MNVEARSKKTKKKNKHKTNRSVLILFFFMFLFAAACLSASELDDTLMHLDAGLDLALDRAKVWSKYAKDVICYVEKRTHLGNLYLIIFYLPPCNPLPCDLLPCNLLPCNLLPWYLPPCNLLPWHLLHGMPRLSGSIYVLHSSCVFNGEASVSGWKIP